MYRGSFHEKYRRNIAMLDYFSVVTSTKTKLHNFFWGTEKKSEYPFDTQQEQS